jgi:hypothetical protein
LIAFRIFKLEEAIMATASMSDVKQKLAAEGFDAIVRGQKDFTAYIKLEMQNGRKSSKSGA